MVTSHHYSAQDLSSLLRGIEKELPFLLALSEEKVLVRPGGPGSWSPKEELGHLIDSAANNHMRFVRGALEASYAGPGYAQNAWVQIHGYQEMPWEWLVNFWLQYNVMLAGLIGRIAPERLETPCVIGGGAPVTLGFVIEDYILHMQHHVDHILGREVITEYPSRSVAV